MSQNPSCRTARGSARKLPVWAAALLASLACGPARADGDKDALEKGTRLYEEAIPLLEAKKFADACPKLEEAIRLVPIAIGARLALAECDEGRGRLASALAGYRKAQSLAAAAKQSEREQLARRKADELAGRVGSLRIEIAPADEKAEGLAVELDGVAIDASARAAPIPVDAGKHTLRATAKGKEPFVLEVDAADGKESRAVVTFAAAASPTTATPGQAGTSPLFVAGIAGGALGVVALGVGGGLGALSLSKNDESFAKGCVKGQGCPAGEATDSRKAAYDAAAVSTALFIGGGVLLAAGVTLIVVAPKGAPKQPVTGVALRAGPGGLSIAGRFQ